MFFFFGCVSFLVVGSFFLIKGISNHHVGTVETCLIKTSNQAEKCKLGATIKLPARKLMVFFMSSVTQICSGLLEGDVRSFCVHGRWGVSQTFKTSLLPGGGWLLVAM